MIEQVLRVFGGGAAEELAWLCADACNLLMSTSRMITWTRKLTYRRKGASNPMLMPIPTACTEWGSGQSVTTCTSPHSSRSKGSSFPPRCLSDGAPGRRSPTTEAAACVDLHEGAPYPRGKGKYMEGSRWETSWEVENLQGESRTSLPLAMLACGKALSVCLSGSGNSKLTHERTHRSPSHRRP
jgi:hypothetical protein